MVALDTVSMLQILVAAIAATALILTSGYALGNVRRRKAIKELIDIRDALGPEESDDRSTMTALISREISVLDTLSNPRQKWLLLATKVATATVLVAWITGGLPQFIPDPAAHDVLRYTSAAATLVTACLAFSFTLYFSHLAPRRWKQFLVIAAAIAALAVGVAIAMALIHGTPYSRSLLGE